MFAAISSPKFHLHVKFHLSALFPAAAACLILLGVFRVAQLLVAPAWIDDFATPLFEGCSLLSGCLSLGFFVGMIANYWSFQK